MSRNKGVNSAETMFSRIERLCLDRGMKMTGQRRIIARVLSEATDHPDVEQVYQRAAGMDPRISLATVYRTLRLFDVANIIDRLDFGDGRSRYEAADDREHHHHLIDVRTGQVVEFESVELEELKRKIAEELGYELVGERLELYGVPRGTAGEGDDGDGK
jgi:Fur family ferric uptake transcriptional regulator